MRHFLLVITFDPASRWMCLFFRSTPKNVVVLLVAREQKTREKHTPHGRIMYCFDGTLRVASKESPKQAEHLRLPSFSEPPSRFHVHPIAAG